MIVVPAPIVAPPPPPEPTTTTVALTASLSVSLTADEKAAFKARAAEAGLSMSAYARRLLTA